MKKVLLLLICALMIFTLMPSVALAAAELNMQISFEPTSLMEPGTISLTITLTNSGDDIEEVSLNLEGEELVDFGNMPSGDFKEYDVEYEITSSKIGAPLEVKAEYVYQGEVHEISRVMTVEQREANINVSTVVKVDKTAVPYNGQVNFTFAIENQGDVAITDAQLSDSSLNGGKVIGTTFSLEPAEAKMIPYTGTIIKDITVKPVLRYKAAGKSYSKDLEEIKVFLSESDMKITASTASTNVAANEEVEFKLELKNTGNVDLKNVKLYDSSDKKLALSDTRLAVNGTLTATPKLKFSESQSGLFFYVRAEDQTGQSYEFNSNELDIAVTSPAQPSSTPSPAPTPTSIDYATLLGIEVECDKPRLEAPGDVVFTVKVQNKSDESFKNVVISETTLGNIDTSSTLAPGEKIFTETTKVETESSYVFSVSATSPDGKEITIKSPAVRVLFTGEPISPSSSLQPLLWVIIAIIVLIIGVGVTLFILIRKEKKKKAAQASSASKKRKSSYERTQKVEGAHIATAQKTTRAHEVESFEEDDEDEPDEPYDDTPENDEPYEEEEEITVRRAPSTRKAKKGGAFDDRNNF